MHIRSSSEIGGKQEPSREAVLNLESGDRPWGVEWSVPYVVMSKSGLSLAHSVQIRIRIQSREERPQQQHHAVYRGIYGHSTVWRREEESLPSRLQTNPVDLPSFTRASGTEGRKRSREGKEEKERKKKNLTHPLIPVLY